MITEIFIRTLWRCQSASLSQEILEAAPSPSKVFSMGILAAGLPVWAVEARKP